MHFVQLPERVVKVQRDQNELLNDSIKGTSDAVIVGLSLSSCHRIAITGSRLTSVDDW